MVLIPNTTGVESANTNVIGRLSPVIAGPDIHVCVALPVVCPGISWTL